LFAARARRGKLCEVGTPVDRLAAGQEALGRGAWAEARASFEAAVAEEESPHALEGLGVAAWWLEDTPATIEARQRAYRLYRADGNAAGAARAAIGLVMDYFFEGDLVVARGWMQRARRLLEGSEPSREHGWLAIWEAHLALMVDHDPVAGESFSTRAAAVGKALPDIDLEMLGLAYGGFSLVLLGRIDEGMRWLDEATTAAMSGEMRSIDATATACCCLIYACERVRDYGRAAQWCQRLKEFCERWSYELMFSICRAHYAGILAWGGSWAEAERELTASIAAFERTRPAAAAEALVRLAELRCRQGRFDEAERLLERAESGAARMQGRTIALLARAELALCRGDVQAALDWTERFLAVIPPEAWMERAAGLEVLVQVRVALGAPAEGRETAEELQTLAERIGTEPMVAAARFAGGIAADDPGLAKRELDAAVALYERSGAPFEAARARVELARRLSAMGREPAARRERDKAVNAFRVLGALAEVRRAVSVLEARPAGLTPREVEIVRLVAQGSSNDQIADRLYLSVRTVERHLSNAYRKVGVEGKTARAAVSAFAATHSLL
jgi:DNA-binding NarL/FixJ family response regulator